MATRTAKPAAKNSGAEDITPIGLLRYYFGYDEWKEGQEDAINTILSGRDVFINFATNGGKSMCYQIPALLLPGLTVVVSPLISLMHDQVDSLERRGIPATYLDSTLSDDEIRGRWEMVHDKKIKLLYVSVERLASKGFYDELGDTPVSLLVVDEAHCISMWGHDFRREYLLIPEARRKLGFPRLMALTATATVVVREEILRLLGIPESNQIIGDLDRPNIDLAVKEFYSERSKFDWLEPRLLEHAARKEKTIVYYQRIDKIELLAERLKKHGKKLKLRIYHGRLDGETRSRVEEEFRTGKATTLLCTNAFGMGVDIPDIRNIYHYMPPDSLEGYWQEIGRAGRDGKPSSCILMHQRHDLYRMEETQNSANPDEEYIRKVWTALARFVPDWQWQAAAVPSRNFYEDRFVQDYTRGDKYREGKVRASIAALCEHGIVRAARGEMEFLVRPKEVEDRGYLIDPKVLEARRDSSDLQFRILQYYLHQAKDDLRGVVLDHFRYNSVAPRVTKWYTFTRWIVGKDTQKEILRTVAARDFQLNELVAHLISREDPGKSETPSFGMLTPNELRRDIQAMVSLGLLQELAVGDRTFLTVTESGTTVLESKAERASTYASLQRSMHSPANKELLEEVLRGWWRSNRGHHTPDMWWRKIDEFLAEGFDILDKPQVTGLKLVADFTHKKPVMKRDKAASATTGRVGQGVTKKDAKFFLNYLFDNGIVT